MTSYDKVFAETFAAHAGESLTTVRFLAILMTTEGLRDHVSAIGTTPVYYSVDANGNRAASYANYPILFKTAGRGNFVALSAQEQVARKSKGRGSNTASLEAEIAKLKAEIAMKAESATA